MKRLWLLVINGLSVLLLSDATPVGKQQVQSLWQHVNRTCLVENELCDQNVSVKHVRDILRNMNTKVNPCEDFHAYACGNWSGHTSSHPLMTSIMKMADSQITEKYMKLFESLLRDKHKRFVSECNVLCSPEDGQVYDNLIKYYNVCQKSEAITLRGYFNVLSTQSVWRAKPYNWLDGVAQVTRYGQSDLFLQMYVNPENATYHLVHINPFVNVSVQFTRDIYDHIGGYTRQNYNTLRRKFERLEKELLDLTQEASIDIQLNAEIASEQPREEYTLQELEQMITEINWRKFLQPQLGELLEAPHFRLHVEEVEIIRRIAIYLNRQGPELLLVYTLARFANYLDQMPHNLMKMGVSSEHCMRHVRKLFHQPMTFLYEKVFYATEREQSEPLIRTVFEELKHEFHRKLQRNSVQLSASAIDYMQRKLETVRLNVGNIALNTSAQFYIDYMRGVNVSNNFYSNHLQALQHSYATQRSLAGLQPGLDDDSPWHTLSYHAPHMLDNIDSTAYYYCLNNMIILPHAYMQLPLFHHHFWLALIYGDLANTLGHELMHAFDSDFLLYDYGGNYIDNDFLLGNNQMEIASPPCLSAGTAHPNERIADIRGTRLAIDTFMRDPQFLQQNGRLFFLQFAQFFCGSADEATHNAEDPTHDMDRVRLNYAMAQTPEFAQIFNCPVGSPLHPAKRCELW